VRTPSETGETGRASGELAVDYAVLEAVRSRFVDSAWRVGQGRDLMAAVRSTCLEGCGEFGPAVAGEVDDFAASWSGVFTVLGDSLSLVAENIGAYAVDLSQVDVGIQEVIL
jgi:hypothetical protein